MGGGVKDSFQVGLHYTRSLEKTKTGRENIVLIMEELKVMFCYISFTEDNFVPRAENVHWFSLDFKTTLNWTTKSSNYTYTVLYSWWDHTHACMPARKHPHIFDSGTAKVSCQSLRVCWSKIYNILTCNKLFSHSCTSSVNYLEDNDTSSTSAKWEFVCTSVLNDTQFWRFKSYALHIYSSFLKLMYLIDLFFI